MSMTTTTIFNIIRSELIKKGNKEIVKDGELIFFDEDYQFTKKILTLDNEVMDIVNDLFSDLTLKNEEYDNHFKQGFLYRFVNRQINRQTIEAFKMELLSVFLTNETFINTVYEDMEKYIEQTTTSKQSNEQKNKQLNDGSTTTDNRQAFADLPQSSTNLDVDNTVMDHATDNTISRNKQKNKQETKGETSGKTESENKTYQLDELLKSNGLLEQVYDIFDRKCFLQVW